MNRNAGDISYRGQHIIGILKKYRILHYKVFVAVYAYLLFTGCNASRFLDKEKGEMFLSKNEIVFQKDDNKLKGKSNLEYELLRLTILKPNRRFFFIPRQYFYYTSRDTIDKSKFGMSGERVKQRLLAEDPVLIDTSIINRSTKIMEAHLQSKGYFFAAVTGKVVPNKKKTKAKVTYQVRTGGRFTIDTLIYFSKDTNVTNILNSISYESLLKTGSPIDKNLYQQEVSRITKHLRDNGYAYFYPQYISNLQGIDSSNTNLSAKLKLEVQLPAGKEKHQRFTIGSLRIDSNYDPYFGTANKSDTIIGGIYFLKPPDKNFTVKPRTILNSLFIKPGSIFSQQELDNTIRQLSSLGVFRPPNIRYERDSLREDVLNFTILLSPNVKWEIGFDFDISTTERKSLGRSDLLGLSISPSLRNRNFLRGAELLAFNTDLGIELSFPSGSSSLINAVDMRLQVDLFMPRMANYLGIWKNFQKAGIISSKRYNDVRQKATSRFSTSYNLLVLLNNYQLQFANLSFGYEYPISPTRNLVINHMGFDVILPKISPNSAFDSLIQNQPLLRNSFSRQFITGLLLRDISYTYISSHTTTQNYWFFRGLFDVSGIEAMGVHSFYKAFSNGTADASFFGIDLSHYLKLEADLRRNWVFSPNRSLVGRINAGITSPYYTSNTVPYVKQFYVGGPYSLRGWYARSLGPGLYRDPIITDPIDNRNQRNLFYQSGDIKLEMNLEYRFLLFRPANLFSLYGALFFDAGNIWTRQKDESRPGSHFALTRVQENNEIVQDLFLKEIALGGGFGLRMDFTYFLLRLDLGIPLRNNYPDKDRNFTYWVRRDGIKMNDVNYNLAIGYPF